MRENVQTENSVEVIQGEIGISGLRPAAMLADGQSVDAAYAVRLEMSEPEPGCRVVQAVIVNNGAAPLHVAGIRWRFDPLRHDGPALRFPAVLQPRVFATENLRGDFFFNGTTEGDVYAHDLTNQHIEYGHSEDHVFPGIFVASANTPQGLFIAQATQRQWHAVHIFRGRHDDRQKWLFEIEERLGGTASQVLAPGEELRGEQMFFQVMATADPQQATGAYFRWLHVNGTFARRAVNPLPSQRIYCTWNYDFHADITEEKVLGQIPVLKKYFPSVKFLQIDDGYQFRHSPRQRAMIDLCYGDPEYPFDRERFPAGPKALADRIKAEGLRPAIWLGLWASLECRMLTEHPDWILRDDTGEPMVFTQYYGGTAILDPSVPGVRDYLDRLCRTVFGEWGFEGVKLDFSTIAFNSKRARYRYAGKSAITLRHELETIFRKHLPSDGFFGWCVVCGAAQPFLSQADYFRNAIDIGRGNWQNVRRIALWTANTRMFLQEAPCLPNIDSVGWSKNFTDVEWESWLDFCAISGGALEVSGDLRVLPEVRLKQMARTLELSDPERVVRSPGLGSCQKSPPPVWLAQGAEASLAGVFNWEDEERVIDIASALPEHAGAIAADALDGSSCPIPARVKLAPHASKLWILKRKRPWEHHDG